MIGDRLFRSGEKIMSAGNLEKMQLIMPPLRFGVLLVEMVSVGVL